jgi:hypothetical protein
MECVKCVMSGSVADDNFTVSWLLTIQHMSWEHCVWYSHMWDEFYQIKKPDTWHTIDPEGLEVMMNDFSCVHWVFNDDDDDDDEWVGIELSCFAVWFDVESHIWTVVSTVAF